MGGSTRHPDPPGLSAAHAVIGGSDTIRHENGADDDDRVGGMSATGCAYRPMEPPTLRVAMELSSLCPHDRKRPLGGSRPRPTVESA